MINIFNRRARRGENWGKGNRQKCALHQTRWGSNDDCSYPYIYHIDTWTIEEKILCFFNHRLNSSGCWDLFCVQTLILETGLNNVFPVASNSYMFGMLFWSVRRMHSDRLTLWSDFVKFTFIQPKSEKTPQRRCFQAVKRFREVVFIVRANSAMICK